MSLRISLAAAIGIALSSSAALAAGPGMPNGAYVGVTGGVGVTNFVDEIYDWYGGTAGGVLAGGQIGYNMRAGAVVLGIEADATWSNKSGPAQWSNTYTHVWEASLRGRVGFDGPGFTPYVTGGVAIGNVHSTYGDLTYTPVGWTVGIGAETALKNNLTAGLEYRHTNFGTYYFGYDLHPADDSIRLSLNMHLGQ